MAADAAHDDVADELGDGRGAAAVADDLLEALEHGAVGIGVREVLDELDADVAHVDVGADEHVGLAGDLALAADLLGGDLGTDGGVELELAVDLEVGTALLGDLHGCADLVDERALGGAVGGVGEHGHAGLPAHEGVDGLGGGDGDGGELLGVGVDAHGGVAKAQERALGAVPAGDVEDAERGDGVDAVGKADDGLAADDDVAGGAAQAAEGDVDVVDALHHEAAVHGLLGATTDGLALERELGIGLAAHGEGLVGLLVGGVDDVDVREVDADLLGGAAQDLALADDEALGETALVSSPTTSIILGSSASKKATFCTLDLALSYSCSIRSMKRSSRLCVGTVLTM